MVSTKTNLLNNRQIEAKIKRMAFEIAEKNFFEENILVVGVLPNGVKLAEKIIDELALIIPKKNVQLVKLKPKEAASESSFKDELQKQNHSENFTLLFIDDVANTGKTMVYALRPALEFEVYKIQTAVLVERKHKNYPIKSDFIGLSLSTNLKEYIKVDLNKMEVYLE